MGTAAGTGGSRIYLRLLGYVRPYWRLFIPALLAMVVAAATETGFPALMKPMLDGSFVAGDPASITWIPVLLVLLFLVRGLARFVSSWCMGWVGSRVVADLRQAMFERLLDLPARYFDNTSSGTLLSRFMYNVEQVTRASTTVITILVRDSLTILGLLAYMFYLSPLLASVFIVVGPAVALAMKQLNRRMRKLSRRVQTSMGQVSHTLEEAIGGYRVVKLFGGQEYEQEMFAAVSDHNRRQQLRLIAAQAVITPVVQLLAAVALAVVVYLATVGTLQQEVTVGSFVAFMVAMVMLLSPLKRLSSVSSNLQKGIAAGESLFEFLDEATEPDSGRRPLDRVRGKIEFIDVGHSYGDGKGAVVEDISFSLDPGQSCALVGPSGSGKSTLVNLLARFYERSSGRILLDGLDIEDLSLSDLRRQIALVSQDISLFNDTIAQNIAYGRKEASREAIISAARVAHATEFIERLPEGFDSVVGENGVLLSGGQRQRLAIARAVLKDAPILVLDEATAALDAESEAHVRKALESLMEGRTTLIVTHRLASIRSVDRIVVLEAGRVVQSGSHDELVGEGGLYARLLRDHGPEKNGREHKVMTFPGGTRTLA